LWGKVEALSISQLFTMFSLNLSSWILESGVILIYIANRGLKHYHNFQNLSRFPLNYVVSKKYSTPGNFTPAFCSELIISIFFCACGKQYLRYISSHVAINTHLISHATKTNYLFGKKSAFL
jgi:hypothetical protein